MKQLFENWRDYVNEQQAPTPQQKEEVNKFIESVMALIQAHVDADDGPLEEAPGARSRMRRRAKQRKKEEWVAKIKDEAGIDKNIDKKDFTPEQKRLYRDQVEKINRQTEADEFAIINTIANGNMLNVPGIKDAYKVGGNFLKAALGAVIGPECVDNLSITCIATAVSQTGMLEQKKEKTNENN
jgi:hypothetical protein